MTLDQAVALSLAPALRRPGLTDAAPRERPRTARTGGAAAGTRTRSSHSGLPPRYRRARLERPAIPDGAAGHSGHAAGPLVSRSPRRARRAGGGDCRLTRGDRPWRSKRLRASEPISAARGVVVVSGLARGVDSAAHRGALTNGRTIAVLGSGLERVYPAEHKGLAEEIAGGGLVLSEHAPDTPPLPFHFPLRNRLISGLSRAVVVIEASDRSGSLITAACALEQGREVMAVPGNVLSGRNRGGHALIRDGATIVECADDIVAELGLSPGSPEPADSKASRNSQRLARTRCCSAWRPARYMTSMVSRACPAWPRAACCPACSTLNCADSCGVWKGAVSSARHERASVIGQRWLLQNRW